MKKFKGSWLQLLLSVALPILFLVVNSLVVVNYLSTNAIPLDDTLLSEDYAMLFQSSYLTSIIVCILINIVFVLAMVFMNMNSKVMWWIYLVINMAVSCVFVYKFNVLDFPSLKGFGLTATMYMLLYFVTYFISSIFTCSDYMHFNPIARFIRR